MKVYPTETLLEAAACLWEHVLELDAGARQTIELHRRNPSVVDPEGANQLRMAFECEGTAAIRMAVIQGAHRVCEAWDAYQESGERPAWWLTPAPVDCFDWDFVPAWFDTFFKWDGVYYDWTTPEAE